jgi:lipopolysaccharide export system ATP-binding protein
VDGLNAGWGSQLVLRDFDLRIAFGEKVAVIGPNGAGKTTLFDALAGRLRPLSGKVELAGATLGDLPLHERALLGLGYVPQEPCVFPDLTVLDNLVVALQSPAGARAGLPSYGEAVSAATNSLQHWSLSDLAARPAAVLSGGERRRLEVARALLLRPRVLLLDEPFTGLDPGARRVLRDGLASVGPATTLVVTDHSAEDVLTACERVVVLLDGKIVFDGPTGDFQPGAPGYRRYFGA